MISALTNSVCHSHVLLFIVDSISKTKLIAPSGGWCWPLFSYFFCKERIREIAFQRLNDSCLSLCSKRSGVVIDFMRISWERCKEYSHEVEQQLSEYCPECICKCVFEKYCHRSSAPNTPLYLIRLRTNTVRGFKVHAQVVRLSLDVIAFVFLS